MGWQKTFSLSKRAKGCHLVTEEVLAQINPGLQGVEVRISSCTTCHPLLMVPDDLLGWHALLVHVRTVIYLYAERV